MQRPQTLRFGDAGGAHRRRLAEDGHGAAAAAAAALGERVSDAAGRLLERGARAVDAATGGALSAHVDEAFAGIPATTTKISSDGSVKTVFQPPDQALCVSDTGTCWHTYMPHAL